jgi:hypothetical protein
MEYPFLTSGDERSTTRRTYQDDMSDQSFRDPRQPSRNDLPRKVMYEFDFDLQMYVISNFNEEEVLNDLADREMIWDPTEDRYIRVEDQPTDRPWIERITFDPNLGRDVSERYQDDIYEKREKIFIAEYEHYDAPMAPRIGQTRDNDDIDS